MDGQTRAGVATTYPVTFRLERTANHITGYYSTDGGHIFTKIGTGKSPGPKKR